jgi:hypothetical protein
LIATGVHLQVLFAAARNGWGDGALLREVSAEDGGVRAFVATTRSAAGRRCAAAVRGEGSPPLARSSQIDIGKGHLLLDNRLSIGCHDMGQG